MLVTMHKANNTQTTIKYEPWNHGIMESWNHGIMESWNHGIIITFPILSRLSKYSCAFFPSFKENSFPMVICTFLSQIHENKSFTLCGNSSLLKIL